MYFKLYKSENLFQTVQNIFLKYTKFKTHFQIQKYILSCIILNIS